MGTNAGAAVAAARGAREDATILVGSGLLTGAVTFAEMVHRISEALTTAENVQNISVRTIDLAFWLLTPKGLTTLVVLAMCFGVVWIARRIAKRTAAVTPQPAQ